MDGFFHFLQTLVLCVAGLIALTLVLFVVVMSMKQNPLRDLLASLLCRLGATAGVTALAPVVFPTGAEVPYDLAGTVFLVIYWFGFFRDAVRTMRGPRAESPAPMQTVSPAGGLWKSEA